MVLFFLRNSSVELCFSFLSTFPASLKLPHDVVKKRVINKKFIFFILIFNKQTSHNKNNYSNSNKYIGYIKSKPVKII